MRSDQLTEYNTSESNEYAISRIACLCTFGRIP
jgi:hypothetical protein